MKEKITQCELKRVLHYDPKTGVFTWKVNTGPVKVGTIAGCFDDGYIRIRINKKMYYAQLLAYLYMKGYFPEYLVDHKDGIGSNNKWSNLRHVTTSCNMQNTKIYNTNTSGFPGVCKDGNKWKSSIKIKPKIINLGSYYNPLEAALARFTLEQQCSKWTCNYRSELVLAIRAAWPGFKF